MRSLIPLFTLLSLAFFTEGQNLTQIVRGRITDQVSTSPLPGATIIVLGTDPLLGASADANGNFVIRGVPVGRQSLKVTFIGYKDLVLDELLISSGKEMVVNASLQESVNDLSEVVVKADKSDPINPMATVSARQLSMEEASRYAGGFNDPARLATSFAGVAGYLSDNGIVIRGNAPKGLSWRMEGVPISNPSHFANVSSLGAGAITALSDEVMANSDFLTGAFPAEYGNALSGVFDIHLRSGNNEHREYAAQIGLSGIAASAEGPFIKGKQSSYLVNYRFSIFDLLSPILPPEMGKLRYHDLSFNTRFPAKNAGTFSVWGIGAKDFQGREAKKDSSSWQTDTDKEQYRSDLYMYALGINHRIFAGKKAWFNTTLSFTGNGLVLDQQRYDESMAMIPYQYVENTNREISLTTNLNAKLSSRHSNMTGISVSRLDYNWLIRQSDSTGHGMITFVNDRGTSYLVQGYSQSRIRLPGNISINAGIHSQYFALNGHITFEPRAGIKWDFTPRQSVGIAYGLHSQLELLNFYLTEVPSGTGYSQANRDLNFSKAHHLVVSYEFRIRSHTRFRLEPYCQWLFDIPVVPGSYYSLINLDKGIFFNDSLVNRGTGRNIGIDITLERFLHKGFYYLVTVSLFDSRYRGGDGVWRNSRFNKNYVVNLLGGKEWKVGKKKNNLFNINLKLCLMGGDYMTPVNMQATYASQEIVEDVSRAFTQRKPDAQVLSLSLNYRINKRNHASIWEFSFINILGYKELNGYYFDTMTQSVREDVNQLVVPNLSYRIEF